MGREELDYILRKLRFIFHGGQAYAYPPWMSTANFFKDFVNHSGFNGMPLQILVKGRTSNENLFPHLRSRKRVKWVMDPFAKSSQRNVNVVR